MGGLKMKIKKVKCRACAREFDEDKITMLDCLDGKKYLCHDCLLNTVNSRKSEMFLGNMPTVVTTGEQNQYILMASDNVKALDDMLIELEEYHKKTSGLILRIRKHMDYFKINWESENDL